MAESPRKISPLGIVLGAFITPFLFNAAGLPTGWIFQGVFQFIVTIAATIGIMHVSNSLVCWLSQKGRTKREKP